MTVSPMASGAARASGRLKVELPVVQTANMGKQNTC